MHMVLSDRHLYDLMSTPDLGRESETIFQRRLALELKGPTGIPARPHGGRKQGLTRWTSSSKSQVGRGWGNGTEVRKTELQRTHRGM